jgi:predicted RNA-binding Zn-ribbon protein involved in translation (DUF1610 family)
MFEQKCVVCKKNITSEKDEIHIMDEHGFTHHYCAKCGDKVKERLKQRDDSIMGK